MNFHTLGLRAGWLHNLCGPVQNENMGSLIQKLPSKALKYKAFSFLLRSPFQLVMVLFAIQRHSK